MAKKQAEERPNSKPRVMANPEWAAAYGGAWDAIAAPKRSWRRAHKERFYHGTDSQLATLAMNIVQYVAEMKKPDGERLPGFHEAQLDSLKFRLFSPAPDLSRRWRSRASPARWSWTWRRWDRTMLF